MGLFHDGPGGDELVDFMDQAPKKLLWAGGLVLKALKPAIRDLQAARDQAALQRAAAEMQQKIQSPDSPSQSPASRPPVAAAPDLSPPPTRKSKG
jgi:hypothetical protein